MKYNIQAFTEEYLPPVMAIENSVFKSDSFPESVFIELLQQPNVLSMLVMTEQNELAGYAMVRYTFHEAEILTIAVANNFLRKGVGKFLMENIIIYCLSSDINDLFLEVRPSNKPAINLYKKFGAERIGIRKNYYENEDAYVYRLKLPTK
jgi:ribosomal-protein-alanine N-acetyltransferase